MFSRLIIRLNNFIVRKRASRIPPANLLLLMPHCLQRSECDRNLVHDINSCERCRRCDIAGILDLRDELGVQCKVVGGGREAVRLARGPNVKAVVACACEKELVDGIRAAFPVPVLAVTNSRPNGPCKDTRVNKEMLRSAVLEMISNKRLAPGK